MKNVIIGLGNAGSQIVRLAAESKCFNGDKFFAIDSVSSNISMDDVTNLEVIPIISDEKSGSGRNRKRGLAMFRYHMSIGTFNDMLEACDESSSPIILVSSSSGGTGSGSIVGLAEHLIKERELDVIPFIVSPAMEDPDSYHMNTSDLLIELSQITDVDEKPGIRSYSIFRNPADPDYTSINKAVVRSIETVLGYHYDETDKDSIDDSDLATIMKVPGRFISVYCEAPDTKTLKKEITRAVLSGYQPSWTAEDAKNTTFLTAFSLTSMFAAADFRDVFSDICEHLGHTIEQYKNVKETSNADKCYATAIIAGLPTIKIKEVDGEFKSAGTIADGVRKVVRPSFLGNKSSDGAKPTPSKRKKKSILSEFGLD